MRGSGGGGRRRRHGHAGLVLVHGRQRRRAREHDVEDDHLQGRARQRQCSRRPTTIPARGPARRGQRLATRVRGFACRRRKRGGCASPPSCDASIPVRQAGLAPLTTRTGVRYPASRRGTDLRLLRRGPRSTRGPRPCALRSAIRTGSDGRHPRRGVHVAAARHARRRAGARRRWRWRRTFGFAPSLEAAPAGRLPRSRRSTLCPGGQLRLRDRRYRAACRRHGGRRDR